MTTSSFDRWLHRYAVFTAMIALLPIGMGALVTSLDAGMAFMDWPTSDGQNMFFYPWLRDFHANRDKFVEHGHRLAGSLIGMLSIGLVVLTVRREPRRWVRGLSIAILAAVVLQGLLGGFRVIADARVAALVHGLFASLIFATITVFVLATGSKWQRGGCDSLPTKPISSGMKSLAIATPLAIFGQSLLGGLVRHLGLALHEHLGGAILATALTVAVIVASCRSGQAWLRSASIGLSMVLLFQLVLGAGAWATRFGFPPAGYVAVQQAPEQILFRTAHAVAAMFVLMMSVQLAVRVLRLNWLGSGVRFERAVSIPVQTSTLETCSKFAGGPA
ncbi:MAG: cytochrome c oxidase assembly protein subunit 15 [Planctomycetota bacterium]|nr:MAG: cytochrome c oxidase assembly protein subunit 15 [Planctomycetota bacterium]